MRMTFYPLMILLWEAPTVMTLTVVKIFTMKLLTAGGNELINGELKEDSDISALQSHVNNRSLCYKKNYSPF
jgi:hypothetical protein